jgi:RNA polymerase sigma-70 factor (ECF subfamily)
MNGTTMVLPGAGRLVRRNAARTVQRPVQSLDEESIVRRCQEGDQDAFRVLVERYEQRATRLAYRFVRRHDVAKDIAQEAFIRAYRSIKEFRSKSQFYTWFYRILVNLALDHIRRDRTELAEFQDDTLLRSQVASEAQVRRANPGEALWRKEQRKAIVRAIDSLQPDQRQTIVLREFEGLSYEEIAQVTKVPIGTVMSRLFYARRKLQDKLRAYLD